MNGEREDRTGAPPATRSADPATPWRLGYRPALDGVRALAIAGVFLVHLHEDTFSLGALGVDVFFVLSGFLITLLLLQEHDAERCIRFAKFYGRRALRLLPVLYAALAVVLLHALLTKSGNQRTDALYDVGFGAVYLKNWESLVHPTIARGPLVHLWSLSLEEQFYLVWPPVLALFLARGRLHGARLFAVIGFLSLAGVRLFALPDPTTLAGQRADALLLGCAAGMTMFLYRGREPDTVPRWASPAATGGLVALLGVLLLPLPWRFSEFVERLGLTLLALAAGALIVGVVLAPSSPAARLLSLRPVVFVGRISYGLYVWHLIVFKLLPPKLVPANPVAADLELVSITFVVAIISFVVIERPALALKARLRVGGEVGPSPELLEPLEARAPDPNSTGTGASSDPRSTAARAEAADGAAPADAFDRLLRTGLGHRAEVAVVAAITLIGGLCQWWVTSVRGIGLTNDAVAYLSAAQNILSGRGFGTWQQMPLTHWPLGYPVLLAGVAKVTGLGVTDAGRLLAVVLSVATGWATWRLATRVVPSPLLRLGAVLAVVLAAAMSSLQDKLLSDATFTLVAVLLVLAWLEVVRQVSWRWFLGAVVLTWLLFLTRYQGIGAAFVGAGVLLLFPAAASIGRRLRTALAYGALAVAVPAVYLARNASALVDQHADEPGRSDGIAGLRPIPGVFADWLVGKPAPSALAVLGAALLLVLGGAAVVLLLRSLRARRASRATGSAAGATSVGPSATEAAAGEPLSVLACSWLGLLAFMAALRLVMYYEPDSRTLSLLYPLSVVFVAGLLARVRPGRTASVATAAFLGWCLLVSVLGIRSLSEVRSRGSGYLDRAYDPIYAELRAVDLRAQLPTGCELRSNQANLLFLAGIEAQPTPHSSGPDPVAASGRPPCVIWVDAPSSAIEGLAPLDEVTRSLHLTPTYRGTTFTVYLPEGQAAGPS